MRTLVVLCLVLLSCVQAAPQRDESSSSSSSSFSSDDALERSSMSALEQSSADSLTSSVGSSSFLSNSALERSSSESLAASSSSSSSSSASSASSSSFSAESAFEKSSVGSSTSSVSSESSSLLSNAALERSLSESSAASSSSSSASSASSSSFSAESALEKSSVGSSTSSASSGSSSLLSNAALEKSSSDSSAASSSSSLSTEAALEKSSVDSAAASLASSSAQSSSVASSDSSASAVIHNAAVIVDSVKSEASGVSSLASSVASAGSVGVDAKPEVGVDSVKAEPHKVAAAPPPPPPPPTSGLTVEAVGSSSDSDVPLKKVPVYVPVEYSASYQPDNFFNPYTSPARFNPYSAYTYRTPGLPWYQLVSPEVPILTLYSGESQGADTEQREAWASTPLQHYVKAGLACSHPESRWGYVIPASGLVAAPASGLVAAPAVPYSPESLPIYRLHLPTPVVTPAVLSKISASWIPDVAKAAVPWSSPIQKLYIPDGFSSPTPVDLPTSVAPPAVLGKISAPWTSDVAKAAVPWSSVYNPIQKLYIPNSVYSPSPVDLVKTSSGEVSPWIPLGGFVDQAKSAWSPNYAGAPVYGMEKAHVSSPWASLGPHPNVGLVKSTAPWTPALSGADLSRMTVGAPWASTKISPYAVPSGLDLTRGSAPDFPWIPLEPSAPKEVRKDTAYNSLVWNPVLEETLKQQHRASAYPGSKVDEYSYPPRYFLHSVVGRRQ